MRFGIDIGGTFTDFVLVDESSGAFHTFKLLSTPESPEQSVLAGLAKFSPPSTADGGPLGSIQIVHGSTVATNALLERKGARTAFIATAGFGDILAIGRQNREQLYDFFADRPEPLVPTELCLEVRERVDHQGRVLQPLDPADLPALAAQLDQLGVESVAVCLLFSFLHPAHEQTVAQTLRQAGLFVSTSHEVLPEFREYERASTTTVNAYVAPVVDRYLQRLAAGAGNAELRLMQSNGGSLGAAQARREAVRSILSGPAAGVTGAFHVAQQAGFDRVITFDMGGTSTDVSLCDGAIRVTSEAEIGGLPIRVPVIDIHTVGAGGGSIAAVDAGGALHVGPQSAGADPGPVCYGRGGTQATVTDANLVLGRLAPDRFLGGQMALDAASAHQALTELARTASLHPAPGLSLAETAALGVVRIANAHMERALRVISVARGHDPRDFALISFGGAGGLHACDLARSLGVGRALIPRGASTLSAFGMLVTDAVKDYVQTVMLPGDAPFVRLEALMAPLVDQGLREIGAEGVPAERTILHRELDVRYVGQSYELTIALTPDFATTFHAAHHRAYGHSEPGAPLEIVNLRLRATGIVTKPSLPRAQAGKGPAPAAFDQRTVVLASGRVQVPLFDGGALQPGQQFAGPAVVVMPDTTVLLQPGDLARVDPQFNLVVEVTAW